MSPPVVERLILVWLLSSWIDFRAMRGPGCPVSQDTLPAL